jgi:hypothetical protein
MQQLIPERSDQIRSDQIRSEITNASKKIAKNHNNTQAYSRCVLANHSVKRPNNSDAKAVILYDRGE